MKLYGDVDLHFLKFGALINVSSQPHASPAFTPGKDLQMHSE